MNLPGQKILTWMAFFSHRHYKSLLWTFLILVVCSGWLVSRLQFQTDVANLLPVNAPATGAFVKFLKEYGATDTLFIVLERESGGEVTSLEPFAEIFVEQLLQSGEFQEIAGWTDKALRVQSEEQFIGKALLFLSEDELHALEAKLTDEAIERQIRALKAKLHSPLGSWASQWMIQDPLGLWPLFQKHIPPGKDIEFQKYLLSEDRKMMLLITKPKGSAPDVLYDEILLAKVKAAEQAAREIYIQNKKGGFPSELGDLKIGLTGGYMHALEDRRIIKKDLIINFSVSLLGVMTIFLLAFRRLKVIGYAFFPLLASPILTLGFLSPFLGRISESTGAFAAIIIGLSIDFLILLYIRYLEERTAGLEIREALEKCLVQTGPAVFTGAITTAVAYYALLLSDFGGVQELGLLTGTGILISMLCAFLLFPALVSWREKVDRNNDFARPVFSFGLERLVLFSRQHPFLILFLSAAITLILLPGVGQINLNNDPKRLRPADHASLLLEERIREKMGEGQDMIVVFAKTPKAEGAIEVQGRLKKKLEAAIALGLPISGYESLASFIPPSSQQLRNLQWIKNREKDTLNFTRVERKIKEGLRREGLQLTLFEPALLRLQKMLSNREGLTWEDWQKSPLSGLAERLGKESRETFISVAYLHVKPDFWAGSRGKNFIADIQGIASGIQVTGAKLVQWELENLLAKEAKKVLLVALTGVLGLIFLDFRSLKLTLLSILPVILASLWVLGLMGLGGIDMNFMNLIVFSMVFGIGVDYGVHILHRGMESGPAKLESGLIRVGKGVSLAALTTLVGFGSLILSGFPGLQSMGLVALLGVGFSALVALTVIPLLLQKILPKGKSS